MPTSFVPDDFAVPHSLAGPGFRLEPLGADHNERDREAWMSSIDHIKATPGFESRDWPKPMSLAANLADLVAHADDFAYRRGFTYSVLDGDRVIGCVYIYPSADPEHDASVRSWVRESRSEMDQVLWETVTDWLAAVWPFANPEYAPRGDLA